MAAGPDITVVLPTRDRPAYLAEAVASVVAQRGVGWELVVVDDGSASPATVPADPRVHLVRLADSAGSPARARNVGLAHATAEVVAFLDDDDQFAPDRLAVGLRGVDDAPVGVCGSRFLGETTNALRCLDGDVGDTILDSYTPCLGATTVRRASCPDFDERWRAIEDVDWWWRTAQSLAVATTSTVGYLVRRHAGPRGGNGPAARLRENLAFLDEHEDWFAGHRRAQAFRLRRAAALALTVGDHGLARRLFVASLRSHPSARTAWQLRRALPLRRAS